MKYQIERISVGQDATRLIKARNEIQAACGIRPSDQDFQWSYEENPAGMATSFLAKNTDKDDYFGIITAFPRVIALNQEKLRAAVLGEFLVKSNYLILGPALELSRAIISAVDKNEFDLVYGFGNEKATAVIKRAGFRQLGRVTRRVKILKTYRYLKKAAVLNRVTRGLSLFADIVLRLGSLETWYRFKAKSNWQEVSTIDERFDELLLERRPVNKVLLERRSSYLRWRFLERPTLTYSILALQSDGGRKLTGYLIYHMDGSSVVIDDFLLPSCQRLARASFAQFLRSIKSTKSPDSIVLPMPYNLDVNDTIKGFGFFERKSDRIICAYWKPELSDRFPVLDSPQNWLLASGDDHV